MHLPIQPSLYHYQNEQANIDENDEEENLDNRDEVIVREDSEIRKSTRKKTSTYDTIYKNYEK